MAGKVRRAAYRTYKRAGKAKRTAARKGQLSWIKLRNWFLGKNRR